MMILETGQILQDQTPVASPNIVLVAAEKHLPSPHNAVSPQLPVPCKVAFDLESGRLLVVWALALCYALVG